MGLAFHYSGRIKDYAAIDALTEEVKDIAETCNWKSGVIDDEDLKGIYFAPKESEPVFLTFTPEGRLCSPISIMYNKKTDSYYYTISTKTQFAGMDAHIAILKLLNHLQKKYFSEFQLDDEGYYWNQWDEDILRSRFKQYNMLMDKVQAALENFPASKDDTPESLAERLGQWLKKKLRDDDE